MDNLKTILISVAAGGFIAGFTAHWAIGKFSKKAETPEKKEEE